MFDWWWTFLYKISRTLFKLIDGLMSCANMLCGINPVSVNGEQKDLLYYLFSSNGVWFAFKVAALLGMIVLVIFSIFAIIRAIVKEKPEGTPGQICLKAFKTLLMFLFVPFVMIAVIWLGNMFLQAMYQATSQGTTSIGTYLFVSFAQEGDGGLTQEGVDFFLSNPEAYKDVDLVWHYMGDLSNFEFIFSWLAGGVILVSLAGSMLLFVERIFSIIILYIVSPFSISTAVLDDGAHFKLWRDQIMVKFISGYGAIIALNIYAMICGLVANPQLVFFENSFINLLVKLLLIGGGAFTLKKSMAMFGNLVQAGAGSNELRDNDSAFGGLRHAMATALGISAAKGIVNSAIDTKKRDLGERLLSRMGMPIRDNRAKSSVVTGDNQEGGGSQNSDKPQYGNGNNNNSVRDAIAGNNNNGNNGSNNISNQNNDNGNANRPANMGDSLVNSAIQGGGYNTRQIDDEDDLR